MPTQEDKTRREYLQLNLNTIITANSPHHAFVNVLDVGSHPRSADSGLASLFEQRTLKFQPVHWPGNSKTESSAGSATPSSDESTYGGLML